MDFENFITQKFQSTLKFW